MNNDFQILKSILAELRLDYISLCDSDLCDQQAPITERDIVAEIYCRLKVFCKSRGLNVHCEIKPASNENVNTTEMKELPRIDVGILSNINGKSWLLAAKKLQNKYKKGLIEARFSLIPLEYFHTAIEVKIQSNRIDAKKDIDTLKKLHDSNNSCNCFFILMNARGQRSDHDYILKYADQAGICTFEYTCK
jgi:hypothetical protein